MLKTDQLPMNIPKEYRMFIAVTWFNCKRKLASK